MKLYKLSSREELYGILLFVIYTIFAILDFPGWRSVVSCLFILPVIFYWDDREFRKIVFSFPMLIWLVLTLYQYLNGINKQVPEVNYIDLLHGFKVYSCILVFAYWASIDFTRTVNILVKAYFIRCVIVLAYLSAGGIGDRLTGAGGSATGLGQFAAILGIFIAYLNAVRYVSFDKNVFLSGIPLLIIFLTQSRNPMAMFGMSLIITYYAYTKYRGGNVTLKFILFLLVGLVGIYALMPVLEDTAFAERVMTVQDRLEESYTFKTYATGTIFDTIVGDRLVYYVLGFEFFKSSPITGIGVWNYRFLTGGTYPLHSEYMVHLCEGGIIAAALWLLFHFSIIRTIRKIKFNKTLKWIAAGSLFILLFCGIYAREFFYEFFHPVYGLILALGIINKRVLNGEEHELTTD